MTAAPQRLQSEAFFTDGLQVKLHRHALAEPFPLHWHEFYELTLVLAGAGSNTVNGVEQAIAAGDAFLLTPADFHRIAPAPGTSMTLCNLIFTQAMVGDELMALLFAGAHGRYARFDGAAFDGLRFRLDSIADEHAGRHPARALAAQSELNRVLIAWHRHAVAAPGNAPPATAASRSHPGLHKALVYIQHHFRQPLTLEEAARQAHLSPNYFSEQFRKATGIAFQNYLQQLRLHFAHALLQASKVSVTEVCFVAGFNTLTHFERVFRQRYGITPSQAQRGLAPATG